MAAALCREVAGFLRGAEGGAAATQQLLYGSKSKTYVKYVQEFASLSERLQWTAPLADVENGKSGHPRGDGPSASLPQPEAEEIRDGTIELSEAIAECTSRVSAVTALTAPPAIFGPQFPYPSLLLSPSLLCLACDLIALPGVDILARDQLWAAVSKYVLHLYSRLLDASMRFNDSKEKASVLSAQRLPALPPASPFHKLAAGGGDAADGRTQSVAKPQWANTVAEPSASRFPVYSTLDASNLDVVVYVVCCGLAHYLGVLGSGSPGAQRPLGVGVAALVDSILSLAESRTFASLATRDAALRMVGASLLATCGELLLTAGEVTAAPNANPRRVRGPAGPPRSPTVRGPRGERGVLWATQVEQWFFIATYVGDVACAKRLYPLVLSTGA